jgi:hypothetical protein
MRLIVTEILSVAGTPRIVHEIVCVLPVLHTSPPFGETIERVASAGVPRYISRKESTAVKITMMPMIIKVQSAL